ncbi:hypothetical protein [Spiroplasma endosymbiont of Aspidapion aeneum]|uniref:hypothetical protein n=1 Tax=Spiroplasma endosymbiont of Aspidapion aeneum TaxID=3066276 RepID=UPI00313D296B
MERPNIKDYGWTVYIPWTKQRRRYNNEYEDYKLSKLDIDDQKIYKIRKNQLSNINFINWLLIAIITTLWGFYYHIPFLQNNMPFLSIGLHRSNPSWVEKGTLFFVPAVAGTSIHNLPKFVPSKKFKFITHAVIKIIPIIILITCAYLPLTENKIFKIKRGEKNHEQEQKI